MKILLVDDSHAVQNSFGDLLASVPHIDLVGCAANVAKALAVIEAQAPDLVVLDVELRRGENGIGVLRRVIRARPGVAVVVLSNSTWQAVHSELPGAGAAACFDKTCEAVDARDWIAARAAAAPPSGAGHGH